MAVARITEIVASSDKSWDDAVFEFASASVRYL